MASCAKSILYGLRFMRLNSWSLTTSSISSPIVLLSYPPTAITVFFSNNPKAPDMIMFALILSNRIRAAKKERSYSRDCILAIIFLGSLYFITWPFFMTTPLAGRTLPPTAITFSSSRTGRTIFSSESCCKIESASMQINQGYLAALIPAFKLSAFPPFFLRIKVMGTFWFGHS